MNISELKEMAREFVDARKVIRGRDLARAILSLLDDDGEELVRLAETVKGEICATHRCELGVYNAAEILARAVLSRYSKREKKISDCRFCGNDDQQKFGWLTSNSRTQISCQCCGSAGPVGHDFTEARFLWNAMRVSPDQPEEESE